jgi:hypothetical protein
MRNVPSVITDRYNDEAVEHYVRATVEPSDIFFDHIDQPNPPGFAEGTAWAVDTPLNQSVGYSPVDNKVVTFYLVGAEQYIKYQVEGSNAVVTTNNFTINPYAKFSCFGDYMFVNRGWETHRWTIDWNAVHSGNTSIFTSDNLIVNTGQDNIVAMHAVSSTKVVVLENDQSGLQARLYWYNGGSWVNTLHPYRFMSAHAVDYVGQTWGGRTIATEYTMLGFAALSYSVELNGDVFTYVSNRIVGSIQGCKWDHVSNSWGDIFTVIPTSIDTSMCELQVANAYSCGGSVYLCCRMKRTNEVLATNPYTVLLKSQTGERFSFDRFTVVSDLGYRFFAQVQNGELIISSCNRVSRASLVYTYCGTSGSGQIENITPQQIGSFQDASNMSAGMGLAAGNEYLLYNNKLRVGSKVTVYTGLKTPVGYRDLQFGSYIVKGLPKGVSNGSRRLSVALQNEADWRLNAMSSPFYTEMASKSSHFDNLKDQAYCFPAGLSGTVESGFSVDFWNCEAYDDIPRGLTGISMITSGGVDYKVRPAGKKVAFRTKDLSEAMSITDYPTVSATSVHCHLYGWDEPQSDNYDSAFGMAWIKNTTTNIIRVVTSGSPTWPTSYPHSLGDPDVPLDITFSGLVVGEKIIRFGLAVYQNGGSPTDSWFNVARLDVMTGAYITPEDNPNTPWTQAEGTYGMALPSNDRPYIMFFRKPADTFNFILSAEFQSTVTGAQNSTPAVYGLVGLALDGNNFVSGRYNQITNKVQVIKVRNGTETILGEATPTTVYSTFRIQFQHHDGQFLIYLWDGTKWIKELTYNWKLADGYMFPKLGNPMHVGVFGGIIAPSFHIIGFDMGADEVTKQAVCIPYYGINPNALDDWPTSGSVTIEGTDYAYTSIKKPTVIRGPWQLRAYSDGTSPNYMPPYGTGKAGLECRDFHWLKAAGTYKDYVIAIDDGSNFVCTDTQWQIKTNDSGTDRWLRNRARYYSEGSAIGTLYKDLSNKVYLTGGLLGITLIGGIAQYHPFNSICRMKTSGTITCKWFAGHSGDFDTTVEDLVETVASFSDAKVKFPGDVIVPSQIVTSGSPWVVGTQSYMSGLDLRFGFSNLGNGEKVVVDVPVALSNPLGSSLQVNFKRISSSSYEVGLTSGSAGIFTNIDTMVISTTDSAHSTRVLFHDNFASVYMDSRWIYSFAPDGTFTYPDAMTVTISTTAATNTISNVRLCDIADWREAIYIDLDTNERSAISDIIQERPVEINGKSDGSISFDYDPIRSSISQNPDFIRDHDWTEQYPEEGASDGIIYLMDAAYTIQSQEYIRKFGFSTRVYRYPNLSTGGIRAARLQLLKFYQARESHNLTIRPDFRLEVGDVLNVDYVSTGTETEIQKQIIIESVQTDIRPVQRGYSPAMQITGRVV